MRKRLLRLHGAILLFMLAPPIHLPNFHAVTRVDASVAPLLSYAPTTVRVKVVIEPEPRNRSAVIEIESLQVFRSSEFPLDGERSPRVHESTYGDLPSGHYAVRVRLYDDSGEASLATARFDVLARN